MCRGIWGTGTSGSSPLARGLLLLLAHIRVILGIIPARAGFTSPGRDYLEGEMDHPRSRGVYRTHIETFGDGEGSSPLARGLLRLRKIRGRAEGSSPLARGLRGTAEGFTRRFRIIPARAGFTADHLDWPSKAEDHPRSRGVYLRTHRSIITAWGSSPLARGLRADAYS